MDNIKISFIATVFNEQNSIDSFLISLLAQTKNPDELIIVDGGSTDRTVEKIKNYELQIRKKGIVLKCLVKKGNRSVGRNEAIKNSSGSIIACSDAGNILDKNWLKNIVKPFVDERVEVVAGYYKGKAKNNFQKALVPYVLIMPERVKSNEFLPATRSVAFRKTIWKKVKGFDEKYSHNEDYVFAKKLRNAKTNIVFSRDAIVNWIPRKNIKQSFTMFYRFAFGDIEAGLVRPKVLFIFFRYLFALFTILGARFFSVELLLSLFFAYFGIYSAWAVAKNYKYVNNISAFFYLPLIQFVSDAAVMLGTTIAFGLKIINFINRFIKEEKLTSISILTFTVLVISVVNWGLPNTNHPFTYHMDEWHQLQSVRHLFTYLSPNIEGSANGPIFHFALSGVYVGLLSLFGLVNPLVLNSSLTNLDVQNTLFIYLRLSTLFFALGSVGLIAYILRKQLKVRFIFVPIFLFLFSPIWISLSNYFKYDIALIFWMLLSALFIFKFRDNPTLKNYLIAGIPVALAICTKISALPLLIVYFLAFVIFKNNILKNIRYPLYGLGIFGVLFLMLGIPDMLLGTGNYFEYFHSNLARTPNETFNYKLGSPYWLYLFTNQIPTLFGFVLSIIFLIAFANVVKNITVNPKLFYLKNKSEIFLLAAFIIFALSLIPMKLFIINRSLVLLPFAVLFIGIAIQRTQILVKEFRRVIFAVILVLLSLHFIQGISWILTKYNDPRELSKKWIEENISSGETVGIENIPIYQFLPDNILFEYYRQKDNLYNYEVIDSRTDVLPEYIIITNSDIDRNYFIDSPKKDLLYRMSKEGYIEIKSFTINRNLNEIFTNRLDFYISLLSPTPNIYIYKKNN